MHLGIKSDACNYMETQFFLKDFYTLLCVNHRNLQIGTPSDSRVQAVPRCWSSGFVQHQQNGARRLQDPGV